MRVLGVMSGTSLDGIDLALCEFERTENGYIYQVLEAETFEYNTQLKKTLYSAKDLNAENFFVFHHNFGNFIGDTVNQFLDSKKTKPHAIASHGHTIFHQPLNGISVQLGSGAAIAAKTGITTVFDFRNLDVALGGQGAPLVPMGDQFLFTEYESCLNIGGIANISFNNNKGERVAFDICFANMALNYLSELIGETFDDGGKKAAQGQVCPTMLEVIKKKLFAKGKLSLAREQFENILIPVFEQTELSIENKLATFCEYIAIEIAETLKGNGLNNVLISGGGAYNKFLLKRITYFYEGKIIIPDDKTIQFKEALIFAFLGYLRLNEKMNTLKSVTGANKNSVGGSVFVV
jgi:anhydro-N-acetylmuramic acid kinase